MDTPDSDPGNGGFPATADAAALISALSLPSIEPFGPDNSLLAGLPAYTPHPAPVPEPASRVSVARAVYDSAVAALAALKCLEDRTAACKAAAVARLLGAAAVEAAATALDPWQSGLGESAATAEIATTLCIPQGSASALAHQAAELTAHPCTWDALADGVLSWRHACTVLAETRTLAATPGTQPLDVTAFEAELLAAAPGTTGGAFASRARRLREGVHPVTLTTRMREAIAKRSLSLDPGRDGMDWLTLHLPAPAANGALAHCTRLARAQQGPGEHRTLDQLRADTAAILLLGQALPDACNAVRTGTSAGAAPHAAPGNSTGANRSGANRSGVNPGGVNPGGGKNAMGTTQGAGQAAGVRSSGARFIGDALSGTILDAYAPFGPQRLVDNGYTCLSLIDVVPDWVHRPKNAVVGSRTEEGHARDRAWETNPENIPLQGLLCPDAGPPSQADDGASTHPDSLHIDGAGEAQHPGENPAPDRQPADVPAVEGGGSIPELITELAAAVQDGVVDGVLEDPMKEYFEQLEATRNGTAVTEPPLPSAQVIVTVPALALLGLTNEPAQLAGHGPIPEEIARKLLLNAGAFLRVLTDPLTNVPLAELPPDRYRLREAEKTLLRALHETCSFPNCTNPAIDAEIDHITPYSQGGPTTLANSHPPCKRHHALKHFRDDKDRHGRFRQDLDPDRAGIRLRGWKASATADGRVGWTSPSGKYHPPKPRTTQPPAYPKWLKKRMDKKLRHRKSCPEASPEAITANDLRPGAPPLIDLHHSPLERLINYNVKHPNDDNGP